MGSPKTMNLKPALQIIQLSAMCVNLAIILHNLSNQKRQWSTRKDLFTYSCKNLVLWTKILISEFVESMIFQEKLPHSHRKNNKSILPNIPFYIHMFNVSSHNQKSNTNLQISVLNIQVCSPGIFSVLPQQCIR